MENAKNFSYYKHRIKLALEEGAVEQNNQKKPNELVGEILNKKNGKYKKLVTCVQLIDQIMPKALKNSLVKKINQKDFSFLPFDSKKFVLRDKIGAGSVSKVYLLESKIKEQPSFALKFVVYYYGEIEKLQQITKQNNKDYEFIRQYYRDLLDLVPPELSFITTVQKNKQPIIAIIQQFAGHDIRDVFKDFSRSELIELLEKESNLRQNFIKFVDLTFALAEKEKRVIDLLGEKNLIIAKNKDEEYCLKFLDPHSISPLTTGNQVKNQRFREALNYLKDIKEEIDRKEK